MKRQQEEKYILDVEKPFTRQSFYYQKYISWNEGT